MENPTDRNGPYFTTKLPNQPIRVPANIHVQANEEQKSEWIEIKIKKSKV